MALISENPPLMVLKEESGDRLVFRFRNRMWGYATLVGGIALIAGMLWYQISHHDRSWQFGVLYFFGFLLLNSTLYSFSSDQSLIVNGKTGSIKFHKKNIYGSVEWERPASEFKGIDVFHPRSGRGGTRTKNWAIVLRCSDGTNLSLGENEFGSITQEGAVKIANLVSTLSGIKFSVDPT
jgi:hypothetical protein